ncbi:AfsR/SARP family transcriptional regulator [Lentzea sp. PSKA42]|uniref:AfsR/SARP family transcriptional regulator n=1 Tax=Lentzea indica TaxID=2604800 RepID=A0ABX1FRQ4_9PSEU|nr:BTAD domain-containing putative transcriptional regulator [Lentzea indica]NKE61698.1 AfsR/SARP family transcriptional regulator [Lentzea indica]
MRVGLLGGVRATTDDGEPIDIGSPRSQAVLAALALSQGTPLPVSRLIDLVWGDAPPNSASKALQWHVAQLRKSLGADAIARVGAAYRLDVHTDVEHFRRCVRLGDTAAAVASWGGVPLAGLEAPGLDSAVAGLTEEWLGAVEMDFSRRVSADPRSVVGELSSFVSDHPTREGLAALLMTALYRTGRQADALAVYQRVRQHLVDELGVEPGPALRVAEQQVLAHAEVPAPVLIGRDADLAAVREALRLSPVVTLVGPGGIGKTRLASAFDGAFVSLAEITLPADVPRAVADALGIVERPGVTVAQAVVAARPSLLVLDNCEHVLDGAAAFASAVCSSVQVLATSRERLSVADEQVVVVEPLDDAASVELFDVRARAADPAYSGDASVIELCRRLDGIPLVIELAAARVRSHRPAELLTRLDIGVRRTGSARHRTVRSAIQWSYDLLSAPEQELFCRLSVFAAPFDLDAVADDHLLGDLVERSTVAVHDGPFGRRFRLLEPLRQFASELLRDRAAALSSHASWCVRQVALIGGLLGGPAEVEGVGRLAELWPNLRAAVTWALESGDVRLADALIRPVVTELPLRGRREIGDWAEQLLAAMASHHTHVRAGVPPKSTLASGSDSLGGAEAGLGAFWLVWVAERNTQSSSPAGLPDTPDHPLSRYARAYASGDGLKLAQSLPEAVSSVDDPQLRAFLELMPSGTLLGVGQFEHVDTKVARLADRYREQGPPTLLHWALQTLGYSAMFQGRVPDPFFDEAADVALPPGTLSANKTTEARRAFRQGDRDKAFELLEAHIDELLETGNVVAASIVALEFIAITKASLREEAATVLGYLKHANDFGAMAAQKLVIGLTTTAPGMGDREALLYMRGVLSAGRGRSGSRRPPAGRV